MKVLIVTGIYPPDHGGPARYVPYLAQELMENEIEVVGVVTLSDQIFSIDNLAFPIKRIIRNSPKPLRMIKTILTIYKMSKDADVVYLNGLVLEGIIACKLFSRKPVVIKVVGDLVWEKYRNSVENNLSLSIVEFQNEPLTFYWTCLRKLQSLYTQLADEIIVPSNFLGKIVKQWGVNSENIHVIYNAIKLPVEEPSSDFFPEYDLVTVARLVPWKGVFELIMICHHLGLSLLVVGDGPIRSELEYRAKKMKVNVIFAGNVPQEEVANNIRKAKLFVLNSSYEGLPHIVLEAKLSKVPVLATSAGGTAETINHNIDGWLVPVGDTLSFRNAISLILNSSNLRGRLARAGYKQVVKNFNPEIQIHQTISVFERVCLLNKPESISNP